MTIIFTSLSNNTVKRKKDRAGFTLVEVLIAMFLVSIAAVIVYTEMLMSYRMLTRSRARLEAQSIAFNRLMDFYTTPQSAMPTNATVYPLESTPSNCLLSTSGNIECVIDVPASPVPYWDIVVTVWVPANSPVQVGTNWLARCAVRRYWRDI